MVCMWFVCGNFDVFPKQFCDTQVIKVHLFVLLSVPMMTSLGNGPIMCSCTPSGSGSRSGSGSKSKRGSEILKRVVH